MLHAIVKPMLDFFAVRRNRRIEEAQEKHGDCFTAVQVLGGSLIRVSDAGWSDDEWLNVANKGVCGDGAHCRFALGKVPLRWNERHV